MGKLIRKWTPLFVLYAMCCAGLTVWAEESGARLEVVECPSRHDYQEWLDGAVVTTELILQQGNVNRHNLPNHQIHWGAVLPPGDPDCGVRLDVRVDLPMCEHTMLHVRRYRAQVDARQVGVEQWVREAPPGEGSMSHSCPSDTSRYSTTIVATLTDAVGSKVTAIRPLQVVWLPADEEELPSDEDAPEG